MLIIVQTSPPAIVDASFKLLRIPSAYIQSIGMLSPKTVKNYVYVIYKWLCWCETEGIQWEQATPVHFTKYINGFNAANGTINYHIARIAEFYAFARKYGLVTWFNQAALSRFKRRRTRLPIALPTAESLKTFIQSLPSPYRHMAALMAVCGLRRAEVTSLKVTDLVAQPSGNVTVRVRGKGGVIRTVILPHWLFLELPSHQNSTYVFSHRGAPYSGDSVGNIFKRTAKQLGVPVHPHLLRHFWATARLIDLIDNGIAQDVALKIVQIELGHASLSTTEIYLDLVALRRRDKCKDSIAEKLIRESLGGGQ